MDSALSLLRDSAGAAGLTLAVYAPREGYIETGWYDFHAQRPVGSPYSRMDGIIRFRFYVDPVATHSRIIAECVRRERWDPSVPERELERMVRPDEPGRALLDRILVAVRDSAVRDTTARDTTERR